MGSTFDAHNILVWIANGLKRVSTPIGQLYCSFHNSSTTVVETTMCGRYGTLEWTL